MRWLRMLAVRRITAWRSSAIARIFAEKFAGVYRTMAQRCGQNMVFGHIAVKKKAMALHRRVLARATADDGQRWRSTLVTAFIQTMQGIGALVEDLQYAVVGGVAGKMQIRATWHDIKAPIARCRA